MAILLKHRQQSEKVVSVGLATPARAEAPLGGRLRRWASEGTLDWRWVPTLLVAWMVVFGVALAIEPTPANPDAATDTIGGVLMTALFIGWGVMAAGLSRRLRIGAAASGFAGVTMLAMAVACPLTGHHGAVAGWWFFEVIGATALIGLSLAALRRRTA